MKPESKIQWLAVLLAMTALFAPVLTLFASPAAAAGETSVQLSASSDQLSVGETTTVEIVTTNADGGVGAYNVSVSLADANARITNASVGNAGLKRVNIADDGSSAQLTVALLDTPDEGTVQFATIVIEGTSVGESDLSIEVTELTDEQGRPYQVANTSGTSVTISDEGNSGGTGDDSNDNEGSDGGADSDDTGGDDSPDSSDDSDSNDDNGANEDSDSDESESTPLGTEQEQLTVTTDTPESTEVTTDAPANTEGTTSTDTQMSTKIATATPSSTEVETAAAAGGTESNTNGVGVGDDATLIDRVRGILSSPLGIAFAIVAILILGILGIAVSRRN